MNEDRLNKLEKRLEKLVDPEADFEYWKEITEWTRPTTIENEDNKNG